MTKYKLLTKKGSLNTYNFDTIDGEGKFSIDSLSGKFSLLETKSFLKGREMNKKNLDYILQIGAEKIIEQNFPESLVYATH